MFEVFSKASDRYYKDFIFSLKKGVIKMKMSDFEPSFLLYLFLVSKKSPHLVKEKNVESVC